MSVQQLCSDPKLMSLAAERGPSLYYGSPAQSSLLRRGWIPFQSKKVSTISFYEVGSARRQNWGNMTIRGGSVSIAALGDAYKEKRESPMEETSTASGGERTNIEGPHPGLHGQHQGSPRQKHDSNFNFDHPIGLTIFVCLVYAFLALSFVPSQLLGPVGILYTVQENINLKYMAYFTFFAHILESIYARYLALKVDADNVGRWVTSTTFYGVFTLRHLIAKAKAAVRKSD